MKVKTKILFKLYGAICWIDRFNEPHYFYIPEQKAIFRWAKTPVQAEFRFKRILQITLKEQNPKNYPYPIEFSRIFLKRAKIREVKSKKESCQQEIESAQKQ